MKIVVSAEGENLDALISTVFGRCPNFVFVDTETMQFEALSNPAMSESGGAGIQAAQFVIQRGAEAVLTGNLGPNAFDVLQAADVPVYLTSGGTVRQAVKDHQAGRLEPMSGANVAAHAGMGRGAGRRAKSGAQPVSPPQATTKPTREAEIAELQGTLKSLRQQLAETMQRIEQLEKEG